MKTKHTKHSSHELLTTKPSNNIIFLSTGNPYHKENNNKLSSQIENEINTLSATQLKDKYLGTYSSWKNMKQRRKEGAIIDPSFEKFTDFLRNMGPRPSKNHSIDRIDNHNHTYCPMNSRWADKHTQNSNKSNNVYLTHKGETLTVAQWAAKTKQNADTLYKRKNNGWTDEEVITGKRNKTNKSLKHLPWPIDNAETWQKEYHLALRKKDISPIEFYIRICERKIDSYQYLIEDLSADPDYDESTLSPRASWDLAAYKLWLKRLQTARKTYAYEHQEAYRDNIFKRRGLSRQKATHLPNCHDLYLQKLQQLTGGRPKDRPKD